MNRLKILIGSLALLLSGVSCSDYLNVSPSTELKDGVTDVVSAQAALNGVYDGLQAQTSYGQLMVTFGDARGGDMQPTANGDSRTQYLYSFNNRTPDNGPGGNFWARLYSELNRTNAIITAFENGIVIDGTEAERNDIAGQAYALRGFFHFDVVKLFGVPYLRDKNAWGAIIADRVIVSGERLQRATVDETYEQVIKDLTKAISLLNSNITISTSYGYMNYWAAKSLLARVYLYKGDWEQAFTLASDVIENGPYELVSNANYLTSWGESYTSESIFSVINTTTDNIARESLSSVSLPTEYGEIILSTAMIDLLREEEGDVRAELIGIDKTDQEGWCKKYPGREGSVWTNNVPVIRLSEVYLIAAEAALKKSSKDQAAADKYLNAIRQRAIADAAEVIATEAMVITERRKELVHEGHRFFDITRQGLTVSRTGGRNYLNPGEVINVSWDDFLTVLPIPRAEINGNPDIQPNPGYTH